MKLIAATTLLITTLTLATPAPVANPEPALAPFNDAPSLIPEIDARAAGLYLERRKKKKGGNGNDGNKTQNNTAASVIPSQAVPLSALGLAIMLWA